MAPVPGMGSAPLVEAKPAKPARGRKKAADITEPVPAAAAIVEVEAPLPAPETAPAKPKRAAKKASAVEAPIAPLAAPAKQPAKRVAKKAAAHPAPVEVAPDTKVPAKKAVIEKAVVEIDCGNAERVVMLIPARTDTKAWQRYILHEAAFDRIAAPENIELVRFLPGRLKFEGAGKDAAPFPSAVVVWSAR